MAESIYTEKEYIEMIQGLKDDMADLRTEMRETKTLIRDYNGLRQKLDNCEKRLDAKDGSQDQTKWTWERMGYLVGLGGMLVAIAALVM